MNDELDNVWRQRANAEPPADFVDRVMAAVRHEPRPSPSSKGVLVPLLTWPAVRVAACVVACLACLGRMAAVVAVFFPQ
jgi:hypothetical protein